MALAGAGDLLNGLIPGTPASTSCSRPAFSSSPFPVVDENLLHAECPTPRVQPTPVTCIGVEKVSSARRREGKPKAWQGAAPPLKTPRCVATHPIADADVDADALDATLRAHCLNNIARAFVRACVRSSDGVEDYRLL